VIRKQSGKLITFLRRNRVPLPSQMYNFAVKQLRLIQETGRFGTIMLLTYLGLDTEFNLYRKTKLLIVLL
jgi:hypothetical protein